MVDKGKKLETDFGKVMAKLSKSPLLYPYRIPDARTTSTIVNGKMRGRLNKRPGDYFIFYNRCAWLIELKEVDHDFRIATKRFTQIAKMRRFAMTNNRAGAIVAHTSNGTYRYLSIEWLFANKGNPSYDLSNWDAYTNLEELCRDKICKYL